MKNTKWAARLAALMLSGFALGSAQAATYSEQPVRLIVPYSAGGSIDTIARAAAREMSRQGGGNFIVENRPGASGNIGTRTVVDAIPDGNTLLVAPDNVFTVNPHLFDTMGFDPINDLTPVWEMARLVLVIAVHESLPVKSIPELIDYAKSKPDELGIATAGDGTPHHLVAEMFQKMAGVELIHVPYKGGAPAIADAAAGHVPIVVGGLSVIQPHVDSGRLRVLAVTQSERSPQSPDIPAVAESLPGFDISSWIGMFAPLNMPQAKLDALRDLLERSMSSDELEKVMITNGIDPIAEQPEDFRARIQAESDVNRKLLSAIDVKR
ncbi:MAG: tripartite tricarboxylate transporter substrate binding protein [Pigmentiphaga sp.]|nr:tripartite tricarboxylate transporter substrate binding protein [Pigmentiphaga sp.]